MASPQPSLMSVAKAVQMANRWRPRSVATTRRESVFTEITTHSTKKKTICYENTYQTEPNDETKFQPDKVRKVIASHLEKRLNSEEYDPKMSSEVTQRLCHSIKKEVQGQGYERYRILVYAWVGKNTNQNMQIASRFLWDDKRDCYATESYSSSSIFATVTVYAVYLD